MHGEIRLSITSLQIQEESAQLEAFGVSYGQDFRTKTAPEIGCHLSIRVNQGWTIHENRGYGMRLSVNGTQVTDLYFANDSAAGTTVERTIDLTPLLSLGTNSLVVDFKMLFYSSRPLYEGRIWLTKNGIPFVDDTVTPLSGPTGASDGQRSYFVEVQ